MDDVAAEEAQITTIDADEATVEKQVDDMMMGRVFGFVSSVGNISIPLAILIFGVLLEYISHSVLLAASGFILMPISVLAYYRYTEAASLQSRQESIA